MPKKPTKPESEWRSPPKGYDWAREDSIAWDRCDLVVRIARKNDGAKFWPHLGPIMRMLEDLLGSHNAKLTATGIKPQAWATDWPWHESDYAIDLTLPAAQWSKPKTLEEVVPLLEHGVSDFVAERGGGASLHDVWSIGEDFETTSRTRQIRLRLALRHIEEDELDELDTLVERFIAIACEHDEVLWALGEITQARAGRERNSGELTFHSFNDWLAYRSQEECTEQRSDRLPGPAWTMLLREPHVKKLGGMEGLHALFNKDLAPGTGSWATVKPLGTGALVRLADIKDVVRMSMFHSPSNTGSTTLVAGLRLFHALLKHDLLIWGHDQSEARFNVWRAEVEAATERAKTNPPPPPPKPAIEFNAAEFIEHVRRRPPASIQGEHEFATKFPLDRKFGGLITAFRIGLDAPGHTHAIYGQFSEETGQLNPVCVGAIQPDRALLWFDSRRHGWDGGLSSGSRPKDPPKFHATQHVCAKCQSRAFKCWAIFQYPGDSDGWEDPALFAKRQDYFSWFWLVAECASCGKATIVSDVECS